MMLTPVAKIRIRLGQAEVEIESSHENMKQTISMIPDVLDMLSAKMKNNVEKISTSMHSPEHTSNNVERSNTYPEIVLTKSDSLTNIFVKMFKEPWGKQPRRLNQIKDTVGSYGLAYPKQSVAVTLLRMVKSGKLRRFKDESGDYVYTASTSLLSRSALHSGESTKESVSMMAGV